MAEKRIERLYGGEIEIEFTPNPYHTYKLVGTKERLISATAVCGVIDKSTPLILWAVGLAKDYMLEYTISKNGELIAPDELLTVIAEAAKQHTVKKEAAATTGGMVHEWIEAFIGSKLNGTPTPVQPEDEQVRNGVNGFLNWYLENDVVFEVSERLVYSRAHGFCGITDWVAKVNSVRTVGDWKTSKKIYDENRLQLAGYWGCIDEEDACLGVSERVEQGIILHCDKETGEFDALTITREEYERDYQVFLAALEIKKWQKVLAASNKQK